MKKVMTVRIFKITSKIEAVCTSESTRYGFRHLATLFIDGVEQETSKACYYNRTWESYEFQSVLSSLINKSTSLSNKDKKTCLAFVNKDHTDNSHFETVSMVAKLGEVFCDNQKEKNDWKTRMIKAGLENRGLTMPEDWDTLDEDEKQRRLDGVLEILDKNPKEESK